jgi:hypothetical protein
MEENVEKQKKNRKKVTLHLLLMKKNFWEFLWMFKGNAVFHNSQEILKIPRIPKTSENI